MRSDVQDTTVACGIKRCVVGRVSKFLIPFPDDGAFTGGFVNDDECDLRRGLGNAFGELRIDAFIGKGPDADVAGRIAAEPPGIGCRKAETLKSDHRTCDLAARHLRVA